MKKLTYISLAFIMILLQSCYAYESTTSSEELEKRQKVTATDKMNKNTGSFTNTKNNNKVIKKRSDIQPK